MSAHATGDGSGQSHPGSTVRVWSPLIRIVHWTLVAAFAIAWLTEEETLQAHVWAGYAAAAAVTVRVVWGLVGPHPDRFAGFLRPPGEVLQYLREAVSLRSRRHVGHSPAGAAMAVALLVSMLMTTATGMVTLAQSRDAGPLAPWFGRGAGQAGLTLVAPARADGGEREEEGDQREGGEGESAMQDIHEAFAYFTLMLMLLHVGGVLLASVAHRENLVASMITGDKRADPA